jgi:hypothetical protein
MQPPDIRGHRQQAVGIITDEKLTRASGQDNSDPAVAAEFLAAEAGTPGGGTDSAGGGGRPGGAGDPDDSRAAGGDLTWYGDSA